jgi:hypothetical protein
MKGDRDNKEYEDGEGDGDGEGEGDGDREGDVKLGRRRLLRDRDREIRNLQKNKMGIRS